jgi:hypothetical protein
MFAGFCLDVVGLASPCLDGESSRGYALRYETTYGSFSFIQTSVADFLAKRGEGERFGTQRDILYTLVSCAIVWFVHGVTFELKLLS